MIYVITHKKFNDEIVDEQHYQILHVGTNNDYKPNYLRDDTGDNISTKNSNYCELTGLYWIWKNGKESQDDITGLVHYRRYFTTNKEEFLYTYFDKMPRILDYSKIADGLAKADVILPQRITIMRTVREFYADLHIGEDLSFTRTSIEAVAPEYLKSFDRVMNGHYFYFANMILCKKKTLDAYCEWLFKVMCDLEHRIDLGKYEDKYQARVFGFISERLIQVWVDYQGLTIKEYPVFNTEEKRITIFNKNYNRLVKLKRACSGKYRCHD